MSIKSPFSFHDRHIGKEDARQEQDRHDPQTHESGQHQRHAAKGRAAYAAKDKSSPPAGAHGSDLGPTGRPQADDFVGHGHGPQADKEDSALAGVSKEALQAECLARLCPECQVKKEADDVRLRSLAELDNARKRLSRERDEQVRFAAEAVLADIIPSLDNLDLALQHAGGNEACKDLVQGVQMTRKLLLEALQKHGLEPVGTVGDPFDPSIHEAVGMASAPDIPEGHICTLVSRGYTLKERLLRPACVVVSKAE